MHEKLKVLVQLSNLRVVEEVNETTIIVKGKRGEKVWIGMNIHNALVTTGRIPGVSTSINDSENPWVYLVDTT